MEILKNFGFDPVMLAAQIVNFLIILFLLKRFLYKPLLDMLQKRQDAIKEGVRQAKEAQEMLEKTLEQEKAILIKAQTEARSIVEDAKLQAQEVSSEIEANTKKQTEKMLEEAKLQIEQESKQMEQRLSEKVSTLALDMLSKSLEGLLSEKEQKQIVGKAMQQIKKIN